MTFLPTKPGVIVISSLFNLSLCHVKRGLDCHTFFKNTKLLSDLKHHSQGHSIKTSTCEAATSFVAHDHESVLQQMILSLLNDFALVASGPGGANNVTAACLELQDESQTYTLRVAKNKSSDQRTLDGLTAMTNSISVSSSASR